MGEVCIVESANSIQDTCTEPYPIRKGWGILYVSAKSGRGCLLIGPDTDWGEGSFRYLTPNGKAEYRSPNLLLTPTVYRKGKGGGGWDGDNLCGRGTISASGLRPWRTISASRLCPGGQNLRGDRICSDTGVDLRNPGIVLRKPWIHDLWYMYTIHSRFHYPKYGKDYVVH